MPTQFLYMPGMGSRVGRWTIISFAVIVAMSVLIAVVGYEPRRGQTYIAPAIYEIERIHGRQLTSVELWSGDPEWFGESHFIKKCSLLDGFRFEVKEPYSGAFFSHTIWGVPIWTRRSGPFFYVEFNNGAREKILRSQLMKMHN
jgi:hypothetical protein